MHSQFKLHVFTLSSHQSFTLAFFVVAFFSLRWPYQVFWGPPGCGRGELVVAWRSLHGPARRSASGCSPSIFLNTPPASRRVATNLWGTVATWPRSAWCNWKSFRRAIVDASCAAWRPWECSRVAERRMRRKDWMAVAARSLRFTPDMFSCRTRREARRARSASRGTALTYREVRLCLQWSLSGRLNRPLVMLPTHKPPNLDLFLHPCRPAPAAPVEATPASSPSPCRKCLRTGTLPLKTRHCQALTLYPTMLKLLSWRRVEVLVEKWWRTWFTRPKPVLRFPLVRGSPARTGWGTDPSLRSLTRTFQLHLLTGTVSLTISSWPWGVLVQNEC